jgi:Co/Zn/Cd efflux system component
MSDPQKRQERMTYVSLVGLFVTLLGAFALRERNEKRVFSLDPRDLALFSLATYRAGRLIAYDRVAEPFRDPVTETVPDEYQAGENVVAEGAGARKALGELVSCPTCVGTWVAAGLVYGYRLAPGPTRLFAAILAVSGLAELFSATDEALSWTGQAARKRSAA